MLQLHILTDDRIQKRYSHLQLAQMAFEGGAQVVQYRNKAYDHSRDFAGLQAICALPRQAWQKVIVNDHPRLALLAGADGVHLGQEDLPPAEARKILGPEAIIGATVHSLMELELVKSQPIDYIGVGPVFGTSSKPLDLAPMGLEMLAEICLASPFPVIAIGNVRLDTAARVLAAGASGVAVISEFCMAPNPVEIAKRFLQISR